MTAGTSAAIEMTATPMAIQRATRLEPAVPFANLISTRSSSGLIVDQAAEAATKGVGAVLGQRRRAALASTGVHGGEQCIQLAASHQARAAFDAQSSGLTQ
jgi:hypothetical protein